MGTTARSRTTAPRRGRGSADDAIDEPRDEYDLLTAMVLGVMVGAGVTLLLRRGPRGHRPLSRVVSLAGTGAATAGRYGARGARWAADRGEDAWERLSPEIESAAEHVGDYLASAREAIDDAVRREVRDLRKSVRRQRKRLGI